MADNLLIPRDLTKVLKIEVKDNSDVLRRFLIDLLTEVNTLKKEVAALEARVTDLETP